MRIFIESLTKLIMEMLQREQLQSNAGWLSSTRNADDGVKSSGISNPSPAPMAPHASCHELEDADTMAERLSPALSGSGQQEDIRVGELDRFQELVTCPLTREVMTDPVVLVETGITYERSAITQWLSHEDTCPMTKQLLASRQLIPNTLARHLLLDMGLPLAPPADESGEVRK